jgi:hypothetical protein
MDINEINVELSENFERYLNECCESESDGKNDGVGAGCCKRRGGVPVAMWCICDGSPSIILVGGSTHRSVVEELLGKVVVAV